ncbi:MAG: hypothetical protein ABIP90_10030, partial [Vicinamibacterales bacterium]
MAPLAALTLAMMWPTTSPLKAQQAPALCVVTGKVVSGTTPLPGVSVTAMAGERLVAAASTGVDGSYKMTVAPGVEYRVAAEMTAFARGEQKTTSAPAPCDHKLDFALVLASRAPNASASVAPVPVPTAPAPAAPAGQRFSTVNVQASAAAAAALEVAPPDRQSEQAAMTLLPPGFSRE